MKKMCKITKTETNTKLENKKNIQNININCNHLNDTKVALHHKKYFQMIKCMLKQTNK